MCSPCRAGGALGAYQAGVYERLAQAGLAPDWLAALSYYDTAPLRSTALFLAALESNALTGRRLW